MSPYVYELTIILKAPSYHQGRLSCYTIDGHGCEPSWPLSMIILSFQAEVCAWFLSKVTGGLVRRNYKTQHFTVKIRQACPCKFEVSTSDVGSSTLNFIRMLKIPNWNSNFQREIQSDFWNSSQTNFSEKDPDDLSYVPLIIRYAETPKFEFWSFKGKLVLSFEFPNFNSNFKSKLSTSNWNF